MENCESTDDRRKARMLEAAVNMLGESKQEPDYLEVYDDNLVEDWKAIVTLVMMDQRQQSMMKAI